MDRLLIPNHVIWGFVWKIYGGCKKNKNKKQTKNKQKNLVRRGLKMFVQHEQNR